MLTGKELGAAIEAAIKLKRVRKTDLAREFGVKPPSISDWCKRGTISKDKLMHLFEYFTDVVGPEHWGITKQNVINQQIASYNVKPIPKKQNKQPEEIYEVIRLMNETDATGRAMALGAVKVALSGYKPTKANLAS